MNFIYEKCCFQESLTEKVEQTIQTLIQAERYEAVGPLCRLAIPIYEQMNDYKSLMSIYSELQQACSRANEIKANNGKRKLGSYFKVVFYGSEFKEDDRTEWIYREKNYTPMAEASELMVLAVQQALGHERVQIIKDKKFDPKKFEDDWAYIEMIHVEPCLTLPEQLKSEERIKERNGSVEQNGQQQIMMLNDPMNYHLHTNVRYFYYEECYSDGMITKETPELAIANSRRVYLTGE